MTPNGNLKLRTACKHCTQQFESAPFEMPTQDEAEGKGIPPARLLNFISGLANHLVKHHKPEMQGISATAELFTRGFTGLMIMQQFDTQDPAITARADSIRSQIHQRTRKHFVTNAAILDLVSRIGLDPMHEATVTELLRGLRDAYEEQGEWSPAQQAKKLVQPA